VFIAVVVCESCQTTGLESYMKPLSCEVRLTAILFSDVSFAKDIFWW